MNREEIIALAIECGDDWYSTLPADQEFLIRFARLVAAAEREACAKEADYEAARWPYVPEVRRPCEDIAVSIRLRSKK